MSHDDEPKLRLKPSFKIWEIYSHSNHNVTYNFGYYASKEAAEESYGILTASGIISLTGSDPESGIKELNVMDFAKGEK